MRILRILGMLAVSALLASAHLHAKPLTVARSVAQKAPAVLALPATFAGVLPCGDCPGIAQTLTLRADGLYRLRRTYVGKSTDPVAELGRWTVDRGGKRLILRSGSDVLYWAMNKNTSLRLLDRQGKPMASGANLDLRRTAQVDPVSEVLPWRGEFRSLAEGATFTDCASGLRWPVASGADYSTLERHYLQSGVASGAPLLVTLDGRLDVVNVPLPEQEERPATQGSAAPREQMVVNRFSDKQAGATCAPATPGKTKVIAEWLDTDWKLIELEGVKIPAAASPWRQVRIALAREGARLSGFSGCNQLLGSYQQDGSALRFMHIVSTQVTCPAPFLAFEGEVLKMLGSTSAYRIDDAQLTLFDGDQVLARFAAGYPR